MHGGMKVYAGAPAAARHYVEADRARADDYYLAEGTGIARRFVATDGHVAELAPLTGEAYEAWVSGRDPVTGEPRGRLRYDARAVRFVEVVVNGPKSWSLAAALHPDIAAAYEGAQDRAAAQIVAWVSQHATTRVGPRGGQLPVSLGVLEAATVRHYTSRAGDPHWHLHLQFNSRVFAAGKWRGLFTVDVRDSLGAINGIGHAAMATDPELNAALAAHEYSKDRAGEIVQLAEFVGPFSARHTQIARNAGRYEREWTTAHPGERAGPALRRSWDARAWAENRPDKVLPLPAADISERWRTMLHELGYRNPDRPVDPAPTPVGALDRDHLAGRALSRLAAVRSAWNPADVRGEVERLITEAGVVTEPAVRIELAEDLTARALDRCVPLLDRDGVPEHIRAWTSPAVLDVEADLTGRLAARATIETHYFPEDLPARRVEQMTPLADERMTPPGVGVAPVVGEVTSPSGAPAAVGRLDAGQAAAATVLAGDRQLVVVEGAAGAGKTTTLAAARDLLAEQGRRLVVVTPTLKAARVAAAEVGAAAGSAAWLAYRHGWRWDDDGAWTRLSVGQEDPVSGRVFTGPTEAARLRAGDLLVVDEAGMLDQDCARALLTVADECQARVALLGDRHQLAAVGRGGVLDLAAQQVDPTAHLGLEDIHRFVRPDESGQPAADREYAALSLAMRAGTDPAAVFDALATRGQIRLHVDEAELQDAVAEAATEAYAAGERAAVVVDTREQADELNAVIHEWLVETGHVDDTPAATIRTGQRAAAGDLIATRRNDPALGVANRDTWTITAVHPNGSLTVTPSEASPGGITPGVTPGRTVGAARAMVRVLPPDYVREHVELAYASTVHAVQGDTAATAHLVIGERTGAASAYVGMTRGRHANTAHLLAADLDEAREQWVAVFGRDRADRGPGQAAQAAARAAAEYIRATVPTGPEQLAAVLDRLLVAWTEQDLAQGRLRNIEHRLAYTEKKAGWWEHCRGALTPLEERYETARTANEHADQASAGCADVLAGASDRIADGLRQAWDAQLWDAEQDARIVAAGPGRLGLHRARVRDATQRLDVWAGTWAPAFPGTYPNMDAIRSHPAGYASGVPAVGQALYQHARHLAAAQHPEQAMPLRQAQQAWAGYDQAATAYFGMQRDLRAQSSLPMYDVGSADALPGLRAEARAVRERAGRADQRVQQLRNGPVITSQGDPTGMLTAARGRWEHERQVELTAARYGHRSAPRPASHRPAPEHDLPYYTPHVPRGPGIGR